MDFVIGLSSPPGGRFLAGFGGAGDADGVDSDPSNDVEVVWVPDTDAKCQNTASI